MTRAQAQALEWLRRARATEWSTDDGLVYGGRSYYDSEIAVAFINVQTAKALVKRGLLRYGPWDPDWGTSLELTEVAAQEKTE